MSKLTKTTNESEMSYGPLPPYICPDENSQDRQNRLKAETEAEARRNNQLEEAMRKSRGFAKWINQ